MINKMRRKIEEKSGKDGVAILWVVLGLIVILTFQGHIDILNQQSIVNEVQQKMDIAGLNTLNKTIDLEEIHRYEDLFDTKMTNEAFIEQYEADIVQNYRKELFNSLTISGIFTNVEILDIHVEFISAPDEGTIGIEHILLDGVVRVTMTSFGNFNQNDGEQLLFELGSEGNTKITSIRNKPDGKVELYLHNQTRLQYQ